MASAAEDIITEIVTVLTVPPMVSVPAGRVFRDITAARDIGILPCIVVEAGDEDAPVRSLIGVKDRRLQVNVTVLAKGASPYQQADDALVESHNRLYTSRAIRGLWLNGLALDVVEGPTRRSRDALGEDVAAITKTYVVEYRTTEASIERM